MSSPLITVLLYYKPPEDPEPPAKELWWIQAISTNDKYPKAKAPGNPHLDYTDPSKCCKLSHLVKILKVPLYTCQPRRIRDGVKVNIFSDFPRRNCPKCDKEITWTGYAYVAEKVGKNELKIYDGIKWGFTLKCSPVPEPSSAACMVSAFAGVLTLRILRRRKRAVR